MPLSRHPDPRPDLADLASQESQRLVQHIALLEADLGTLRLLAVMIQSGCSVPRAPS